MTQIARNITDPDDGFLRGMRYLILVREGVHVVRLPPRSPNLKAFAERFVRSIKEECLSRMIFFGQASLRHAITQYMSHYHEERNHQGLENRLLRPLRAVGEPHARVKRRQRLGGILSYYHREAAWSASTPFLDITAPYERLGATAAQ
jgi:putative transposase